MGFPSIKNDEVGIDQLKHYFKVPEEQANEWALVLCMSPGITGRRGTQKSRTEGGEDIYPGKLLELALSDGFDNFFTDMQLGPKTGDARKFSSMEEVWEAYRQQIRFSIDLALRAKDISRVLEAEFLCCPFISSMDDGCVELGRDACDLAEVPNPWHNMNTGSTCCIDSLAAMQQLIFEEKNTPCPSSWMRLRPTGRGLRRCDSISGMLRSSATTTIMRTISAGSITI
jgi:formate C-acetyltransferase/benzylsuccinate synthase